MAHRIQLVVTAVLLYAVCCVAAEQGAARARTDAGWVCGACASDGDYASFLAVPYAKQPLAALRFQELQPPEPWEGCRDATKPGPVCPQKDVFYGPIMRPSEMSEECIHANVYVPLQHLPAAGSGGNRTLLPVLVYIHGGGFGFGSGDPDLHGPQYLMRKNVVVITFNYRLGPFGFLSLNTSSVPGNAGLRDMVTLLRWVQRNAPAFGGDPSEVTLAGQSAGASSAHLLSLSEAAVGLFKRVILMSGSGVRNFFSPSPAYAQYVAQIFLTSLGINGTDLEEAHRQLVDIPIEKIIEVQSQLQDTIGVAVFAPVAESAHPGVEIILDDNPEVLQSQGRGRDIPFLVGFTNTECETFRPVFASSGIVDQINNDSKLLLPAGATYALPQEEIPAKASQIETRYFDGVKTLDEFLSMATDFYFVYPSLKVAEVRAANGGAPLYMYRFAYEADYSVFQDALNLTYSGAGHSEDLTFVFRANHALGERVLSPSDQKMTEIMTTYVTNFMRYSDPTHGASEWPAAQAEELWYQDITSVEPSAEPVRENYSEVLNFFNSIYTVNSSS